MHLLLFKKLSPIKRIGQLEEDMYTIKEPMKKLRVSHGKIKSPTLILRAEHQGSQFCIWMRNELPEKQTFSLQRLILGWKNRVICLIYEVFKPSLSDQLHHQSFANYLLKQRDSSKR